MSASILSQWSWLDPALRPATSGMESSSPTELTTADSPAAVTLAPDDVKLLSGALHCEIVEGADGGPRVAQIYTLPDPLPCPWPPMGPFSPVRLEDLRMTEVPLTLILDLKQVSEGVKVLKWPAFEPQTTPSAVKPLSTTTNIEAGIPAISQDAKQRIKECVQEKDEDVVDTVDIALDATTSAPSKTRKGGRKRAIEGVEGPEELPEGRTKALKRTYIHELVGTLRTTTIFHVLQIQKHADVRIYRARPIARRAGSISQPTRTGETTPPSVAQDKSTSRAISAGRRTS